MSESHANCSKSSKVRFAGAVVYHKCPSNGYKAVPSRRARQDSFRMPSYEFLLSEHTVRSMMVLTKH